ncbi:MAG: aminotransferase class V-fold PLP-dependent enzyme [Saprospiraceae bacterium]|nr:aminotransferase class V-fold PLP-dependent enzyme [Saprospiraceae bacterium]
MMQTRRTFLNRFLASTSTVMMPSFFHTAQGKSLAQLLANNKGQDLTHDEDFWYLIQQAYTVAPSIINLNNGGVSPQPLVVQEAVERYNRLSNEAPSYYMWRILDMGREPLRMKLADVAGCSPDELAINRNATEALETIIFGLRLKAGDEVVLTKYDYPNMINAWKQREKRDGIILKWLDFTLPLEDEDEITSIFTNAFTAKTKVVHITHIINWTGQILPAQRIASEAKERGIEVLIDAAHSFAHLDYTIPSLDCDYFGTSLHKWMSAPFGSGLLYVKKEKIKQLYPLFGAPDPESEDIRKFENLGTRSFAIEQAIGQAVNFHEMIGSKRKEQRLRYLKNYWLEKVLDMPNTYTHTSLKDDFSCALALVGVKDRKPEELANFLFNQFKIHTVAIDWENVHGVRITPNVYTTIKDLDRLVKAFAMFCES